MTTFQTDNQTVLFSKKFGLITEKQVIITKGANQKKVDFESIKQINLIKSRVFYFNITFFLLSLIVILYSYFFQKPKDIKSFYSIMIVGFALLIFSLIHKFYTYKIVIKEKNSSVVEVKTTQINRKYIKEFYNAIVKKIPKTKK